MGRLKRAILERRLSSLKMEVHQMVYWLSAKTEDKNYGKSFWTEWKLVWRISDDDLPIKGDQFGLRNREMNFDLFVLTSNALLDRADDKHDSD